MTSMPTGPFPVIDVEPMRYDDTRRRAKARRARRTSLVAVASVAVVALGAGLVGQGFGGSTAQPAVDPTPQSDVTPPTDAMLVAMSSCDDCVVVTRAEATSGDTVAVLGRGVLTSTTGTQPYVGVEYVVAHGSDALSTLPISHGTYVHTARADKHGNVLVPYGNDDNLARDYDVVQAGRYSGSVVLGIHISAAEKGSELAVAGYGVKDGELAVVAVIPEGCSTCTSSHRWVWSGSRYRMESCDDCGPVEIPKLAAEPIPAWYPEVGCASGCTPFGHATFSSGHELYVVGRGNGFVLVDVLGDNLLGSLDVAEPYLENVTELVGDTHGNVLMMLQGNTARAVAVVGERDGTPHAAQGSIENAPFHGDNNTEIKDTDGDGQPEILVGDHAPYKSSTTTYEWNGSSYAKTGCTGNLC